MSRIIRTSKSSKDDANEKLVALKQLFPNAFTADGQLDVNILKQLIGADDDANQNVAERFGLTWAGKSKVFGTVRQTTTKTLKPNRQNSVDYDTTQNLFIEGDNLDALKILERSYFNKVKMVYIDPPYNTGNDFVYNDDFKTSQAEHEQQAGTHDEQGNAKRADGLTKNSKDKGRYHSNWLNMMYPRLHIARNLLKDDGVIFVSIDDNEVHHLRMIMDEIFGEENFIAQIIWTNKEGGGSSDSKTYRRKHEYIIAIAKNLDEVSINGLPVSNEERYTQTDGYEQTRGKFYLQKLGMGTIQYSPSLDYLIDTPDGNQVSPADNNKGNKACWRWSKDKYEWGLENGYIIFKKDASGEWIVYTKQYLCADNKGNIIDRTKRPSTVIDEYSTTQASKGIKKLFNNVDYFDYSKPVALIMQLLSVGSSKDSLMLDFFAGSGTTAHAVMQLNAEDGGNRKYICVQLPEITDENSEAYKAGYKTIADIARERIRRAGKKIVADNASTLKDRKTPLDIGFKDFAVAPSNFAQLPKEPSSQAELLLVDNLKPNTQVEDILTQMRLLQGKTLDVEPAKMTFGDLTVYVQDETCFVLQPNAKLADLKQLLHANYRKIVLLDRVFKDSKDMTNFDQEYQALDSQKIIEIC